MTHLHIIKIKFKILKVFFKSIYQYYYLQAYIKNFTLAIRNEFAPHGITVQLVTPMYVQTKMNAFSEKILKGNILIPDVKSYTKSAVFTLGKTHKTTGYWSHGIQVCFIYILNLFILN